ncbi:MAG: SDR family oxidoreductase [Eubacterium sp.]|nr:SDR family oxidoreductase [Eubacterium sp.]
MIDTGLDEKLIIVAGATGGIGSGVARRLDQTGARLLLVGRSAEKLEELNQSLDQDALTYVVDFEKTDELKNVFVFLKEHGLKADGLVFTAGVCADIPIKAVSPDEMERNMRVNYFAFVELSRHFASKRYSNDDGSIVVMSSIASLMCEKSMSQYAASKAAVNAVTSTMAKEFATRHIRVNALAPAFVDTEMAWGTAESMDNFEEYLNRRMPYGVIPVEEIAMWTEFLLSDVSGHITGETIRISGGMY